jgi:pimeloyl-ACP methyl ester carboxylesterase
MHRRTRGLVAAILVLLFATANAAPKHRDPNQHRSAQHTLTQAPDPNALYRIVANDKVHIQVLEQGKGPPIAILPSLGRGARDFDKVAVLLSDQGYRVLRLQPRGIGLSTGPMTDLTLHDYAADVALVLQHEAQEPAIIVGHDWGNWVARTLAVDQPALVRAVVLAAAPPGEASGGGGPPIPPEIREALDKSSDTSLPTDERLQYLRLAFFAPDHDPRVWLTGWHPAAQKAEAAAAAATPVEQWFAAGHAPILELQAENDAVAPQRFSRTLEKALGNRVTVIEIPRAGHALVPEQPEAVAAAIGAYAQTLRTVSLR